VGQLEPGVLGDVTVIAAAAPLIYEGTIGKRLAEASTDAREVLQKVLSAKVAEIIG
jgi:hypothetical protein